MNVLLGVTGSISAYKAVDILRVFQTNGHDVTVIMTRSATKLIKPLTFDTFIPGRVYTRMFKKDQDPILHITLSQENDLFLIAPATANIIGKLANGIADDLLSTTFLAFQKKVVIAPAMHVHMYENPVVVDNINRLKSRGIGIIEPETGSLACGTEGKGRLPQSQNIYNYCMGIEDV